VKTNQHKPETSKSKSSKCEHIQKKKHQHQQNNITADVVQPDKQPLALRSRRKSGSNEEYSPPDDNEMKEPFCESPSVGSQENGIRPYEYERDCSLSSLNSFQSNDHLASLGKLNGYNNTSVPSQPIKMSKLPRKSSVGDILENRKHHHHLLICENEDKVKKSLEKWLLNMNDIHVSVVSHGDKGLQVVDESKKSRKKTTKICI
jgi:hypothetical protein